MKRETLTLPMSDINKIYAGDVIKV